MVKFLEICEDGDDDKFNVILDNLQKKNDNGLTLRQFLKAKNYKLRTSLHLACLTGNVKFAARIINLHRKYGINLDPLDHRNSTPLELLLSHGMSDPEEFDDLFRTRLSFKASQFKLLLFLKPTKQILKMLLVDSYIEIEQKKISKKNKK